MTSPFLPGLRDDIQNVVWPECVIKASPKDWSPRPPKVTVVEIVVRVSSPGEDHIIHLNPNGSVRYGHRFSVLTGS